jgi:RNA polymerase sigma-70 factor (ECF subfamily)
MKQTPDKTSDEDLVNLSIKDQENFTWLIKRYESKLLRYILRIANISKEDAEDILQDVFIKVYQNLNDFNTSLKFSSWIYRIAHNQVISNWRKIKARPKSVYFELEDSIFNSLVSELDLEKMGDRHFLKKNLEDIFEKINSKYKEVLILKFLEEKSYKEISDILKKPIGTVATLINRAKKSFIEEAKKQNIKFN